MSQPVAIASRPQLALQSYLDSLLQDATLLEEMSEPVLPVSLTAPKPVAQPLAAGVPVAAAPAPAALPLDPGYDEFEAAVREEAARDAQLMSLHRAAPRPSLPRFEVPRGTAPVREANRPVQLTPPIPVLMPTAEPPAETLKVRVEVLAELPAEPPQVQVPVEAPVVTPAAQIQLNAGGDAPPARLEGRPSWAEEPFECLLFDVAGLTLAVPLVSLGSIYPLAGQELTPLFGQPEWFLGLLPTSQGGNLKVLDTARWVMPDRYRDDLRQGLQYVISVQGYEWGLAVHQVSRSLRLDPKEIKWRSHRGQRPWLAGTVIEHMCALLDVSELAELIASGAAKALDAEKRAAEKKLADEKLKKKRIR